MRNLKVTAAYRGTEYHGFQRQSNAVTVQETLEKHLSKVLNEPVTVIGCSRTDTGVQIISALTSKQTAVSAVRAS